MKEVIAVPTGWSIKCPYCNKYQDLTTDSSPLEETFNCDFCNEEFKVNDIDV